MILAEMAIASARDPLAGGREASSYFPPSAATNLGGSRIYDYHRRWEPYQHYREWVRSAIRMVANLVVQKPWTVISGETPVGTLMDLALAGNKMAATVGVTPDSGVAKKSTVAIALDLLEKPNPLERIDSFIHRTVTNFFISGTTYWWIIDGFDGMPSEMHIIPTPWVTPIFDRMHGLTGYSVLDNLGTSWVVPAESMMAIHDPHPGSPIEGSSSVYQNGNMIDRHEALGKRRLNEIHNKVTKPQFMMEENTNTHSESVTMFRRRLEQFQGVEGAGVPYILPPGVKPIVEQGEVVTSTTQELVANRDEVISSVTGLSRMLMGIAADQGRSGFEAALDQSDLTCVGPVTRLISVNLTALVKRIDENLRVITVQDSRTVEEKRRSDLAILSQTGACTYNEIRQSTGLKPHADGDRLIAADRTTPHDGAQVSDTPGSGKKPPNFVREDGEKS